MPPVFTVNRLHIWGDEERPWEQGGAEGRDKKEGGTLFVHAGVTVLGRIGITTRLITADGRPVYRGLYVHGEGFMDEPPMYLEAVAILHGLRALHGWMQSPSGDHTAVAQIHRRREVEEQWGHWRSGSQMGPFYCSHRLPRHWQGI